MNFRRRMSSCFIALLLTATVATGGATSATASPVMSPRGPDWLRTGMSLALPFRNVIEAIEGSAALDKGSDGRLTFLLLASDSRFSSVSRTDTMMVISVKGNTVTAASIPRDTALLPRPASMGGGVFPGKANTVLRQLLSGSSLEGALSKFEFVIEDLLRIEIDYWALIWFNGFTTLIDKVDPITVNINREIRDGKLGEDPDGQPGVYFPERNGYAIYAWDPLPNPYCNGAWKDDTSPPIDAKYWCHRALPFMRSRKGPGNSDWVRARRQQEFVMSTIKSVAQSELSALVSTGQSEGLGKWLTNYPITATSALDLYNALDGSSMGKHVVFKPTKFATRIPGSSGYELKVSEIRAWAAEYLK